MGIHILWDLYPHIFNFQPLDMPNAIIWEYFRPMHNQLKLHLAEDYPYNP